MNSRLYKCRLLHDRKAPKKHRFSYGLFLFCLDLDELDELDVELRLFSRNRRNIYSFRDCDYLSSDRGSLKEKLESLLSKRGFAQPLRRAELVTQVRVCGFTFNPVSFIFCYGDADKPFAAVAEVANTFREQKVYVIGPSSHSEDVLRHDEAKRFYVSPYSDLNTNFHFRLWAPSQTLNLVINQSDATGNLFFYSSVVGEAQELSDATLLESTLRFPLASAKVLASIHWQAIKLAAKGLAPRRKDARRRQQESAKPYFAQYQDRSIVPDSARQLSNHGIL